MLPRFARSRATPPPYPPDGRSLLEVEAQSCRECPVVRSFSINAQAGRVLEVELPNEVASQETHRQAFAERHIHAPADVTGQVRCLRGDDVDRVDVVSNRTDAGLNER